MSTREKPIADYQYAIELTHSWTTHLGREDRQSESQMREQAAARREAAALGNILNDFHHSVQPLAAACKRDTSSFQPKGKHHFDGGIDTTHLVQVIAAAAGAVPLSLLIKSAKDVLVAWLAKRSGGISVKLGGGRSVDVRNVGELDDVLGRLEQSGLIKSTPEVAARTNEKAPPAKKSGAKTKAKAKSTKKGKR